MSIFGYILLAIWGAAYLALIIRRSQRRQYVRISGEIRGPDLEVIHVPVESSPHGQGHHHHHADVTHHIDVGSHHH